jgi:hypothetical protein
MNDNDVIVNPIYHENTIHVTDAIFTNEPETFVIAIEADEMREPNTDARVISFKECRECFYLICCMLLCCFSFFILLGGIGVFFMN